MKTAPLLLAVLAMSPWLVHAQQSNNSGLIDRSGVVEHATVENGSFEQVEANQEDPQLMTEPNFKSRAKAQVRQIEISRNPQDMYDTTGMDAYEVITWTDGNGVRHFTDDARKAPKSANKRNIYSLPPANKTHEYRYTEDDVLYIDEE